MGTFKHVVDEVDTTNVFAWQHYLDASHIHIGARFKLDVGVGGMWGLDYTHTHTQRERERERER